MESLHPDYGRKCAERCSECLSSYFTTRAHRAGPWVVNQKRLRCNESLSIGTSKRSCMQCSSKKYGEDRSDLDVGEHDQKRRRQLKLRIRFPETCQTDGVGSIGSPYSESDERDGRNLYLLKLRIPPSGTQVPLSPDTPDKRHKCIEVEQYNNRGENDVRKALKGHESKHNLQEIEEGNKEVSDHLNRIRIPTNSSKLNAGKTVKTDFSTRGNTRERQNNVASSCARTEYLHIRGKRSRVSNERVVIPEKRVQLLIAYDSRRKRTGPQLLDLFVSKSRIHGHGVFTRNAIKTGLIVLEFFGEIVRESVSDLREGRCLNAGMQSFYVFSLVGRERQTDRFCLDSTRKGGLGRFINHCCLPNSEAEIRGRGIVIKTIRDIDGGEEITLDYKMHEGKEKCLCGAENCLGGLGGWG